LDVHCTKLTGMLAFINKIIFQIFEEFVFADYGLRKECGNEKIVLEEDVEGHLKKVDWKEEDGYVSSLKYELLDVDKCVGVVLSNFFQR